MTKVVQFIPPQMRSLMWLFKTLELKYSTHPSKEVQEFLGQKDTYKIKTLRHRLLSPKAGKKNIAMQPMNFMDSSWADAIYNVPIITDKRESLPISHFLVDYNRKGKIFDVIGGDKTNKQIHKSDHAAHIELAIANYFTLTRNKSPPSSPSTINQKKYIEYILKETPIIIILAQKHRLFSEDNLRNINHPLTVLKQDVDRLRKFSVQNDIAKKSYYISEMHRIDLFASYFPVLDPFRLAINDNNHLQLVDKNLNPVRLYTSDSHLSGKDLHIYQSNRKSIKKMIANIRKERNSIMQNRELIEQEFNDSQSNASKQLQELSIRDSELLIQEKMLQNRLQELYEQRQKFVKSQEILVKENERRIKQEQHIHKLCENFVDEFHKFKDEEKQPPYDLNYTTFTMLTIEEGVSGNDHQEFLNILKNASKDFKIVGFRLNKQSRWISDALNKLQIHQGDKIDTEILSPSKTENSSEFMDQSIHNTENQYRSFRQIMVFAAQLGFTNVENQFDGVYLLPEN